MRRALLVVTVLCLSLAACTTSSKTSTNTFTTVASPPTNALLGQAPPTSAGTITTLQETVFIDSVDLNAHTITVDPMSFLTGTAAVNAYKVDHPDAKEGPPNDYYIVNVTKDQNPLPFPATSVVRLVDVGGTNHNPPVKVPQAKLNGYPSLTRRPFVITAVNGSVTGVTERFVP